MRAHMALKYTNLKIILREVELKHLPAEVLAISPHATVPSLVINKNKCMVESWDIVKWALQKNDPENWLGENSKYLQGAEMLVETNDYSFKDDLDYYKYAERHPEHPVEYYRQRGEEFLEELNVMLEESKFLLVDSITIADVVIFPFIRQFAMVDKGWFDKAPYPELQRWVGVMHETRWFKEAFMKREIWALGNDDVYL